MKHLILFALFICSGHGRSLAQKLLMPKNEHSTIRTNSNSYSIILTNDSIYSYEGASIKNVRRFLLKDTNTFRNDLLAKKKKIGENKIIVLIKPSASAYVSRTVEMLDLMVIAKIKKYAMVDLDEGEKKYFHLESFSFNSSEPLEVSTPSLVTETINPRNNAVLIKIDKKDRVYFSVLAEDSLLTNVITKLNSEKNLGLTSEEVQHYKKTALVGMPFLQLKSFLDLSAEQQKNFNQPGIPLDSLGGELTLWLSSAKRAFSGKRLSILIKGDNNSGYKVFKMVIEALKRNELFRYQLVTSNDD